MTNPKPPILRRGWQFLARRDLAAVLLLGVLLAVLGSRSPQLALQVAADPERLAR